MTYLRTVRASGIDPIILDGGDFLFTLSDYKSNKYRRRQMLEKARLLVEAYNRFGYAAAAVAECDLALGLDALKRIQKEMDFPLLCANLIDEETGSPVFPPSTVIERSGVKVGVVAAMLELRGNYLKRVAPSTRITPPLEAIRREVERISGEVDLVFLLGHINRKDIDRIADELPAVDFILEPNSFAGNTAIWVTRDENFVERNGGVLLKVSGQGASVGRIDVTLRKKGAPWALAAGEGAETANIYRPKLVELAPHIGRHAGMQKMVEAYLRSTRFVNLAPEDDDDFQASTAYLTGERCAACHLEQHTFWERTAHARAYATLERTGDQFRYDCIPCHVVGYGETFVDAHKPGPYINVQCESCHGTNPRHAEDPTAHPWPQVDQSPCWACHNPRETRVAFFPEQKMPIIRCPPLEQE
ncbi:MAG: multiheme c-type cytochrome [Planctomycetota bacterium]